MSLGEPADFVSVGLLPKWAFTALAEFPVFGELPVSGLNALP